MKMIESERVCLTGSDGPIHAIIEQATAGHWEFIFQRDITPHRRSHIITGQVPTKKEAMALMEVCIVVMNRGE